MAKAVPQFTSEEIKIIDKVYKAGAASLAAPLIGAKLSPELRTQIRDIGLKLSDMASK